MFGKIKIIIFRFFGKKQNTTNGIDKNQLLPVHAQPESKVMIDQKAADHTGKEELLPAYIQTESKEMNEPNLTADTDDKDIEREAMTLEGTSVAPLQTENEEMKHGSWDPQQAEDEETKEKRNCVRFPSNRG